MIRIVCINIGLTLILLEGISFLYFATHQSVSDYRPSYLIDTRESYQDWMTESEDWGAWHKPLSRAYLEKQCFNIELIANNYGARDKERAKESLVARTVVLGDSFVEGYGVSVNHRFTERLENLTSRKFLNFGAAGNFGPAQYSILYRKLAKEFDHDTIVIGLLLDNDFTDNDPEFWKENEPKEFDLRYRPYWAKRKDGSFDTFYTVEKPSDVFTFGQYGGWGRESTTAVIPRLTWTFGMYREIKYLTQRVTLREGKYSGYFEAQPLQIEATKYFLKEIFDMGIDKKMIVLLIPRLSDFTRLQSEKSHIVNDLKRFAEETGILLLDLAPMMRKKVKEVRKLFLRCDGHWSPLGHAVVADILKEQFFFE